jgi:ATP synthase protein I
MASQDPTPGKNSSSAAKQIALALELPFMLVGPVLLGGAIGYGLDRWLHTKPILMIVFGIIGVAIGIRDALKIAGAGDK